MSGAVINGSELMKLLNLNFTIWTIIDMPTKERSKSPDKRKWHFLFKTWEALSWIQVVSIPKPPIRLYTISIGYTTLINLNLAILRPALVLQSEL